MELGDLSVLQPEIDPKGKHEFRHRELGVCVFYGRDRGESPENTEAKKLYNAELTMVSAGKQSYNYVFTKDGEWKYFPDRLTKSDRSLWLDVRKAVDAEWKYYGVDTRPQRYGFLTEEVANEVKKAQEKEQKGNQYYIDNAERTDNGLCFKDWETCFHGDPNEICYISESGLEQLKEPDADVKTIGYSRLDLANAIKDFGYKRLTPEALFDVLDWQEPTTYLNEVEEFRGKIREEVDNDEDDEE
jgi:hypothetical protein